MYICFNYDQAGSPNFGGVTGVWTQKQHLEPLHQPFWWSSPQPHQDRVSRSICPCWLQIAILLISASWVARIRSVSHWCPFSLHKIPENWTKWMQLLSDIGYPTVQWGPSCGTLSIDILYNAAQWGRILVENVTKLRSLISQDRVL
jgi:hypothetical protein